MARRVEEPYAQCRYEHHANDDHEQQPRDIGRAELSDSWHSPFIISNLDFAALFLRRGSMAIEWRAIRF
jgi:hypothetical protein